MAVEWKQQHDGTYEAVIMGETFRLEPSRDPYGMECHTILCSPDGVGGWYTSALYGTREGATSHAARYALRSRDVSHVRHVFHAQGA